MTTRINNYYFLAAGVLAILFAVTHAWNGHSAVLPKLDVGEIAKDTRTVFTYVWHIITVENLVFGVVFIIMSIQRGAEKVRSAAFMIVWILLARLAVILGVTAFQDASSLPGTLIDSIAIAVYIAIILLGIRMKKSRHLAG